LKVSIKIGWMLALVDRPFTPTGPLATYSFSVIACNNDGVRGKEMSSLDTRNTFRYSAAYAQIQS
jgi:hypothetical protein